MTWGTKDSPADVAGKVIPLIILLLFCAVFAFVGYHLYLSAQQISSATAAKLESKHMSFSKGGLRVGVKDLQTEKYVDNTRDVVVKAWNLSSWPAYKSRLWNRRSATDPVDSGPNGVKEKKPHLKTSRSNPAK